MPQAARKGLGAAVRVALYVAAILTLANACALPAAPLLTDAERCDRFGGSWSYGTCRYGGP